MKYEYVTNFPYTDDVVDFIVVKDFRKCGSLCIGYKPQDNDKFRLHLLKCLLVAKSPIQVVRVGGYGSLEMFNEYSPYTFTDEQTIYNACLYGEVPGEWLPDIPDDKRVDGYDNIMKAYDG